MQLDCLKIKFRQSELDMKHKVLHMALYCCRHTPTLTTLPMSPTYSLLACLLGFHSFISTTFTGHLVCGFHCALPLSVRNGYDRPLPWKVYESRGKRTMPGWQRVLCKVLGSREHSGSAWGKEDEEETRQRGHKGGELALIHQVHWGGSNERGAGMGSQREKWGSHIESRAQEWWSYQGPILAKC